MRRVLLIGPTDNTSRDRTPRDGLWPIPKAARESFVPVAPALPAGPAHDWDMTCISPGRPKAEGTSIEVVGTVRSASGRPIEGALLEIWSANAHGRYTHAEDTSDLPLDPNFLGMGRITTGPAGRYRFRTVMPGAYLARPDIGRWRPKHIHLSLTGGSARLVTQIYFPGDPYNAGDPMAIVMGEAFPRNLAVPTDAPDGVEKGFRFDIVAGGANATYFE
ncbi:MAG: hypothetical protein AAGF30_05970 [Pseudomonadota bacterium]